MAQPETVYTDSPQPYIVAAGNHTSDCPAGCGCPSKRLANPRKPSETQADWEKRLKDPKTPPGKDHKYRRGETVLSLIDLVKLHGDKFVYPHGRPAVVVSDPFERLSGETDEAYKARIEAIRRRALEVLGEAGKSK